MVLLCAPECHDVLAAPSTVKLSVVLTELVENAAGDQTEGERVSIPGHVHPDVFTLINSFCDLFDSAPWDVGKQIVTRTLFDTGVPEAYKSWLDRLFPRDAPPAKPDSLLYQVLHVANFLHIQPLIDLCCAKLASVLMCCSPAEITNLLA